MKTMSHKFRGIASIFLAFLVLLGIAGQIANNWAGKVNELLGVSESTIKRSANAEDYAYQSDFVNPSDLIQAEIGLNTRMAAEGTVALKGAPAIEGTKVTLLGMRSGERMQFGGSMGELIDKSNVVLLSDALAQSGFSVNPDMVEFYKRMDGDYAPSRTAGGNVVNDYEDQGAEINEVPVSEYDAGLIGDFTDAAIIVLGRDAGESACFYPGRNGLADPDEFSQSPTGNILGLSDDERDLIHWAEAQGFGKVDDVVRVGAIKRQPQPAGGHIHLHLCHACHPQQGLADFLAALLAVVLAHTELAGQIAIGTAVFPHGRSPAPSRSASSASVASRICSE